MLFTPFAFLAALLSAPSAAHAAALPVRRADAACNGRPELCARSYGNVTFLGAHDSFAASKNPLDMAADQNVDVSAQLKLGVRMLQAQAHINPADKRLHFCHTDCLLFDGGLVEDYLKKVKTFLDANPREIVTLIFTNPEKASLKDIWAPAFAAAKMDKIGFVPPKPGTPVKRADWPTLGKMLDAGTRFVAFLDDGADKPDVPFLLPQFQMVWEPPFSVTDANFPCKIDRIAGPLKPEEHMHMLNHNLNKGLLGIKNLLVPARTDAGKTNSIGSILDNAGKCAPLAEGRAPNFVMLDFVDVGEGLKAVDRLNGFA